VVCNLRDAQEVAALRRLIAERADVVIQNLRPGHVQQLGLDAATLRADKPSLIYCNLGAFGAVGPLKDRPGYDPLMQAFGGIMSTTGEPGRASVRVAPSIVDMGTGMWGPSASWPRCTAATRRGGPDGGRLAVRDRCHLGIAAGRPGHGQRPAGAKQGSGAPGIAPYKAYATRDGRW
jgi:crotonobetainyl-CoA:carnitine CoA-transferase CaiB-like acyl-CoA transferase